MEGSRISTLPNKIIFKMFLITIASNAIGTMRLNILNPEAFALAGDNYMVIFISHIYTC